QIAVKSRRGSPVGQSQIVRRNIPYIGNLVAGHENVFPSVVVVVEEPAGKTVDGFGHAGRPGHIGENPPAFGALRGITWPVVPEEPILATQHRNIQVRPTVVVE